MSTVIRAGEKPKAVKNLGWLLRNWQGIEYLGFNYAPDNKRMIDGELVAKYKDGTVYITEYASLSVCWNWLNRPVFMGLPFNVVNMAKHEDNRKSFVIGDEEYKQLNRLEYKEFMSTVIRS